MEKEVIAAASTLTGTMIGAGVLGIPYVVAQSGFLTGLLVIIVLGLIMALVFLYMGEVTLRTKGRHQLTGYAEKYLGKKGKFLMALAMILGIYGALVAFLLGTGQALARIFGGSPLVFSFVFFIVVSLIIYVGVKGIAKSEGLIIPLIIGIILVIFFISLPHVSASNLSGFSPELMFLPYGVVLFAFLGMPAIPEMREELQRHTLLMKKSILIGAAIPVVLYSLFALAVVGVSGLSTTEVATIGLSSQLGEIVIVLGNLFAAFAMATTFLALGLALKELYNYDYKLKEGLAWVLAVFVPLALFLLFRNSATFTQILGFNGVVFGGLESILVVLMACRAKKLGERKPEYSVFMNKWVAGLLILLFVGGVISLLA